MADQGVFETQQQKTDRLQREESERQINEDTKYAAFFDALVELFGTAQQLPPGDMESPLKQPSSFTNILQPEKIKSLQSKIANTQGKPLVGFYAMVMQKKVIGDAETGLPAPHQNAGWGYLVGSIFSKAGAAKDAVDNALTGAGRAAGDAVFGGVTSAFRSETTIESESTKMLKLLDFPEYYVFIFSNIGANNPIPTLLEERQLDVSQTTNQRTVFNPFGQNAPINVRGNRIVGRKYANLEAYPLGLVTSKALRDEEDIEPGSIVRVSFEGPDVGSKVVIHEVVESDPTFTEMVMRSLGAKAAITAEQACSTDSVLRNTAHAAGDPIGTSEDVQVKRNIASNGTLIYPFKPNTEVNLVVFYHGVSYGTQQYVFDNALKDLPITSTMFLIPNGWGAEWSGVEQAIAALAQHGITVKTTRLGAWSKGSFGFVKALDAVGAGYFNAGTFLADPSPSAKAYGTNFEKIPSGVYMEYDPEVWNSLPDLKSRFPAMASKIVELGGEQVPKTRSGHKKILQDVIKKLNT
mgnify:CR=1 FL=1